MKRLLFIIVIGVLLSQCHDFLHEYPKDQVYATTISDFNELLVGNGYLGSSAYDLDRWFQFMDDNTIFSATTADRWEECKFHWWEPYLETEYTWKSLYRRIGVLNVILSDIEELKNEGGEEYKKVKGEAHFLRAAYYYFLVNLYSKPYHKTHSATDLGVPLKTTPEIEDKRFSRNTVEECYAQILNDLRLSIQLLKGQPRPKTPHRSGEFAARALLSRVYLYMGDWDSTVAQCDTILSNSSYTLLDFNTLVSPMTTNAISTASPETIFTGGLATQTIVCMPMLPYHFKPTEELMDLYEVNDLRRTYFYGLYSLTFPLKMLAWDGKPCSDFFLIRLPEIYLNMAEALTMLGSDGEALDLIQELRESRLSTGTLNSISLNGEELFSFIRDERRKEFAFEGQRWFDLRRYAVNPKWPYEREIYHPYYEEADRVGDLVLGRYSEESEYYVLPIPKSEITLSGGAMKQNEERAQKTPIQ